MTETKKVKGAKSIDTIRESEVLSPCPYCGERKYLSYLLEYREGARIMCNNCGAWGPPEFESDEGEAQRGAIEKWNARKPIGVDKEKLRSLGSDDKIWSANKSEGSASAPESPAPAPPPEPKENPSDNPDICFP